jgi:hypothetical protein
VSARPARTAIEIAAVLCQDSGEFNAKKED